MSRKITISLWLSLLCLFPIQSMAQTLEYWFDDLYDLRNTTPIATSDAEQELNLDLRDNTKFPMGFHKLNMRVNTGRFPSAVSSSAVLKLAAGNISQLEYWVDDDIANRKIANSKTISGKASNDGGSTYQFFDNLDLTDVTPGYHRLYYRAVSNSLRTTSAISMTPIMVKSLYNNASKLMMKEYSIAIDGGQPMTLPIANPKDIVNIPYTLDARGLSEGEHNIEMSFYNSSGSSVSIKEQFSVTSVEPNISLHGWKDENGLVHLHFNSIPNDVKYTIYRKGIDGVESCIPTFYNHNYPNTNSYIDTPLAGTYSYTAEGVWEDNEGKEQRVRSNTITVTTEGADETLQFGSIEGTIHLDGKQVAHLPQDMVLDVEFDDGEKVRVQDNGTFFRNRIPLGTTKRISIKDYSEFIMEGMTLTEKKYVFDNAVANITKENPNASVTINGTRNNNAHIVQDLGYSDLIITTSIEATDNSFIFDVKNISGHTWSGIVCLKAVKREDIERFDTGNLGVNGSAFSFNDFESCAQIGSQSINQLTNGNTTGLDIKFDKLPINVDEEEYFIYVVSTEIGKSRFQQLTTTVENVENPKLWTLPATITIQEDNFYKENADACVEEVFSIMKILKKIDGPFQIVLNQMAYQLDKYDQTHYGGDGVFGNLPELLKEFGVDLKNAIKDVDNVVEVVRKYKSFCEYLEKADELRQFSNQNSFQKWNTTMKLVLDSYETLGGPLAGIYKLYMDATVKAVDFIDRNFESLFESHRVQNFLDDGITFKIVVKKDHHIPVLQNSQFSAKDIDDRIKSINVYCVCPTVNQREYFGDPESKKRDGNQLVLKSGNAIKNQSESDWIAPKEFWMEIIWKNDRLTKIPLCEGVVDISNDLDDPVITVTLQSGESSARNMDKKIKIVYKNKELNKDE